MKKTEKYVNVMPESAAIIKKKKLENNSSKGEWQRTDCLNGKGLSGNVNKPS
jgi:hypothetical protein